MAVRGRVNARTCVCMCARVCSVRGRSSRHHRRAGSSDTGRVEAMMRLLALSAHSPQAHDAVRLPDALSPPTSRQSRRPRGGMRGEDNITAGREIGRAHV